MEGQNHPLYSIDRDHVNRLLAKKEPNENDLIDLARLINRYEGFSGASDIQADMLRVLNLWNLTREDLFSKTRKIWRQGFRPGNDSGEIVGSGFDTSENN